MKYSFSVVLILLTVSAIGQRHDAPPSINNCPAVFFVDSVRIDNRDLEKYNPQEIARIEVIKDSNAIRLAGPEGRCGVVLIETKAFARKKYWEIFRKKSPEYSRIVPNPDADSTVQYILSVQNGSYRKVLKKGDESKLSSIGERSLWKIEIIGKERLRKEFDISDKAYGVLIFTTEKREDF